MIVLVFAALLLTTYTVTGVFTFAGIDSVQVVAVDVDVACASKLPLMLAEYVIDAAYGGYVTVTVTEEPPKTEDAGFITNPVGETVNRAVAKLNPSLTPRICVPDKELGAEYVTMVSLADCVETMVLATYTVSVPVVSKLLIVAVSVWPWASVDGAKAAIVGAYRVTELLIDELSFDTKIDIGLFTLVGAWNVHDRTFEATVVAATVLPVIKTE